jgi:hypothetical protein
MRVAAAGVPYTETGSLLAVINSWPRSQAYNSHGSACCCDAVGALYELLDTGTYVRLAGGGFAYARQAMSPYLAEEQFRCLTKNSCRN